MTLQGGFVLAASRERQRLKRASCKQFVKTIEGLESVPTPNFDYEGMHRNVTENSKILGEQTRRLNNTNNLKFPPKFSSKKPDILRQLSVQVSGE